MSSYLKAFWQDESGATAIEYGLIAALVSVALIAGAGALGNQLGTTFDTLKTKLATPTNR